MNQILINATHKEEIRVAIVKNDTLTNLNIESIVNKKTKGNIYKAKVSRIEKSLEAAFIDYGQEKHGFLPFRELSELFTKDKNKKEKASIGDLIKEGQEIIVQVEKEERGNKGASLTTYINIAGLYTILTTNKKRNFGISRQISNNDRKNLQNILTEIKMPDDSGLIVRTQGANKNIKELQWEVDHLSQLWNSILNISTDRVAPFLIYQESDITLRTVKNYLREYTDSLIIDDLETYKNIKDFVGIMIPHYLDRIKFFESAEETLFNHMKIESQIKSVFSREISLKSGATIVFDATEALTAIDINSAKSTKGVDIEDTAYKTNSNAVKEIAKQIQMRDIGGLIVIDFIDMSNEEHIKSIEKAMVAETNKDRARVQIGSISKFGLLELSRQRIDSSISSSISKTCSQCNGNGNIPTVASLSLTIIRQIEDIFYIKKQISDLVIQSTSEVVTYIMNEKRQFILDMESRYAIKIILLPNQYLKFPAFSIEKQNKSNNNQHNSYQKISKPKQSFEYLYSQNKTSIPAIKESQPFTKKPKKKIFSIFQFLFSKKDKNNKNNKNVKKNNNNNKNNNKNKYYRNRSKNKNTDNSNKKNN